MKGLRCNNKQWPTFLQRKRLRRVLLNCTLVDVCDFPLAISPEPDIGLIVFDVGLAAVTIKKPFPPGIANDGGVAVFAELHLRIAHLEMKCLSATFKKRCNELPRLVGIHDGTRKVGGNIMRVVSEIGRNVSGPVYIGKPAHNAAKIFCISHAELLVQ